MRHNWLLIGLLFLGVVLAQSQPPAGLAAGEIKALKRLYALSLGRDPGYLQAEADLEAARAEASFLGAVDAGASLTLSGSFDQVRPGYSLTLRLDLAKLLSMNTDALRAAKARAESERWRLYREVSEAYFGYLYAREAARQASDRVEAARAALEAARARARVGAITQADLLAQAEALSRAELSLYKANLDLALAFARLQEVTRLPAEAVRAALSGKLPGDQELPPGEAER